MPSFIEIKNERLRALIAPNNGGMAARLSIDGKDVFFFDERMAENAPLKAGGAPILFPFAGKTKNDAYALGGREYHMPMHGLVKNSAFALKRQSADSLVLWRDSSGSEREANYPFDYMLEVEYKISGSSLFTTARVTNRSEWPMPHCLGWHPYFTTSDKAALRFEYSMAWRYDYVNYKDEPAKTDLDLSGRLDDVFHTPKSNELTLYNKPDGYRARLRPDGAHSAMVVYTGKEGAVCIEPWCALPDSANTGRFLKYVAPGAMESYTVELSLDSL